MVSGEGRFITQLDVERNKRLRASTRKKLNNQYLFCACYAFLQSTTFPAPLEVYVGLLKECRTCRWWQCWAPLHTARSTSTGLCFGCSRQTRPVPGARSAPLLVRSPYVGDRYGGPPSHARRRRVWWTRRKQNSGQMGNLSIDKE